MHPSEGCPEEKAMTRNCTHCQAPFSGRDLAKAESKEMEHERKLRGLHGVRFLYYTCARCGRDDIFVEVYPMPGETSEQLHQRREELEATARQLTADRVEVVVTQK
jgi:hypothetical protein